MKRRLFGTLERLPSKRYRACYKPEGRAVYAQRTFATKADASGWPAHTETDLGRGTWVDPAEAREPFHQYAGTWMIRSDLAGSTHVAICLGRARDGVPTFGSMPSIAGVISRASHPYYEAVM